MIPTTREEFAQFCLRKLGAPVVEINLSEEQVDDCLDEALYYYQEFHMEGTDVAYYSYSVSAEDIANRSITMPTDAIGAIQIYPIGDALNTNSLFNMRYQFVINDLYNISNVSIIPYYMVMQHVQFLEQMLVGCQPVRYNRHKNILYIDMDWTTITEGEFLLVRYYSALNPDTYPDVYRDKFFQNYTTALLKKQWGQNLKKFDMMPLPGGVKLNGQKIYDEGNEEVLRLEQLMLKSYSLPPGMMIN